MRSNAANAIEADALMEQRILRDMSDPLAVSHFPMK